MSRVLLVMNDPGSIQLMEKIYGSVHLPCEVVPDLGAALDRISADPPILVVTEKPFDLSSLGSLQAVLKTRAPATPYLVILPKPDMGQALSAMRTGAYDCVCRPLERLPVLAASKRAAGHHRRSLFSEKLTVPKRRALWPYALVVVILAASSGLMRYRTGPPARAMSLGSAHLAGIQWNGRHLLVGDWFDSTVVDYVVKKGFLPKSRGLETAQIQQMRDAQPILLCNTGSVLVSIGSDLKLRSHHWAIGLPTLQSKETPGPNPTGLAWDGTHIWTTDGQTNFLYRHGETLRVIQAEKSIIQNPVGMAAENGDLWVFGGTPLQAAKLEQWKDGYVWRGPYLVPNLLPERVVPSGMAVGFGRVWVVSGGDPEMRSVSLRDIVQGQSLWKKREEKTKA